jgi:2-methylisocitrate lyase-like PEP mutase family enzyme
MATQAEKGLAFRALHARAGAFVMPNPWDAGTARLLAHLGFEALATTSAGCAFSLGQSDNTLNRDQAMAHASAIATATDLPVSGDLENGFGDEPKYVAETIRLAAAAGVVGGSIEDMTRQADRPIYEKEYAAERIRAAAEASRALPFAFTLTARAENFLAGRHNLADTIGRLQAYQEAGADVLYAPGLPNKNAIAAVVSSVDRPVNVVMGLQGVNLTLEELFALGVRRVSTGSALARVALGAFLRAARGLRETGEFGPLGDAVSYLKINAIFAAR